MIRAPWGDQKYWDHWKLFRKERLKQEKEIISKPSNNPVYRPQYVFNSMFGHLRILLTCYSRGDAISELPQYFNGLLDTWELSNKLSDEICASENIPTCRDWVFSLSNLNHYNWCFWLVGLALLLEVDESLWQRLLNLIGQEGEDTLLDSVIATKEKNRKIGTILLHERPYARLLKAVNASKEDQAKYLFEFVDNWYKELARKEREELWWYIYGDPEKHPLSKGSYFGRWCIEAAVCVKAFELDDSLCLSHEHYPKAFIHQHEENNQATPKQKESWFSKVFDFLSE